MRRAVSESLLQVICEKQAICEAPRPVHISIDKGKSRGQGKRQLNKLKHLEDPGMLGFFSHENSFGLPE